MGVDVLFIKACLAKDSVQARAVEKRRQKRMQV